MRSSTGRGGSLGGALFGAGRGGSTGGALFGAGTVADVIWLHTQERTVLQMFIKRPLRSRTRSGRRNGSTQNVTVQPDLVSNTRADVDERTMTMTCVWQLEPKWIRR